MQLNFFNDIQVLVIDNLVLSKGFLKYALENLGFKNIYYAMNTQQAVSYCEAHTIDLILCDFNLNAENDGYQLYDELKARQFIRLSTVFIFISADTDPLLVNSVLELQPDDFLVKPFTLRELGKRINRLLDQKQMLKPIYDLIDHGKLRAAFAKIEHFLTRSQMDKVSPKLLRLKGELLLAQSEFKQAYSFFNSILQLQNFTWAELGFIRALLGLKQFKIAFERLNKIVNKTDMRIAALDLLCEIDQQNKNYYQALQKAKSATKIAPRNIQRQTKLIQLSRLTHDYDNQFQAAKQIIKYSKNSMYDSPEKYLTTIRASIDLGIHSMDDKNVAKAIKNSNELLSELKTRFPNSGSVEQLDIIQARILNLKNEKEKARQLIQALTTEDIHIDIDSLEETLDRAKSFHELGFLEQSNTLFDQILTFCQQNQSSDFFLTQSYLQQERKERRLITQSPKSLNNNAVSWFKQKHFVKAFNAFKQAFQIMPNNPNIALNLLQTIIETPKLDNKNPKTVKLIERCYFAIKQHNLTEQQQQRLIQLQQRLS